MSDEDEQPRHGHFVMPFQWGPQVDPEEMKRREMAAHDLFAQFANWMEEASKEDLGMMRKIMAQCVGDPQASGPQIIGMISAALALRFSFCMGCGQDHFDAEKLVPPGDHPDPE